MLGPSLGVTSARSRRRRILGGGAQVTVSIAGLDGGVARIGATLTPLVNGQSTNQPATWSSGSSTVSTSGSFTVPSSLDGATDLTVTVDGTTSAVAAVKYFPLELNPDESLDDLLLTIGAEVNLDLADFFVAPGDSGLDGVTIANTALPAGLSRTGTVISGTLTTDAETNVDYTLTNSAGDLVFSHLISVNPANSTQGVLWTSEFNDPAAENLVVAGESILRQNVKIATFSGIDGSSDGLMQHRDQSGSRDGDAWFGVPLEFIPDGEPFSVYAHAYNNEFGTNELSDYRLEWYDENNDPVANIAPPVLNIGNTDETLIKGTFETTKPAGAIGIRSFAKGVDTGQTWDSRALYTLDMTITGPTQYGEINHAIESYGADLGVVSEVLTQGETFTISPASRVIQFPNGNFTVPNGTTISAKSTPQEVVNGDVWHGSQLNPTVDRDDEKQGVNGIVPDYDGAFNQTLPVTLSEGDVLLSTVSGSGGGRSGTVRRYIGIACTDTVLNHNSAGGPTIVRELGDSTLYTPPVVDWATKFAEIPKYNVTGGSTTAPATRPIHHRFCAGLQMKNATTDGYEKMMVRLANGTPSTTAKNKNYGAEQAAGVEESCAFMMDSNTTSNVGIAIFKALVCWGSQVFESYYQADGKGLFKDGGHHQFHPIPCFLYLWATNQLSGVKEAALTGGDVAGNIGQYFRLSAGDIAQFTPHRNRSNYVSSYQYEILSIVGNRITIEGNSINQVKFQSMTATRTTGGLNGAKATIGSNVTDMESGNKSNNSAFYIDVADASGFAVGDFINFEPVIAYAEGDAVWGVKGNTRLFCLNSETGYIGLQRAEAFTMLITALGEVSPDWSPMTDMVIRAATTSDYGRFRSSQQDHTQALWTGHWTTISATSQPRLA